jgi:hypothetical protein
MNDSNFETTALFRNGILVLLLVSIALIVHNIFGQNGYLAAAKRDSNASATTPAAQTGK